MSSRNFWPATLTVIACLVMASCADFSRGPASPAVDAGADGQGGDSAPDDGAPASFAASIHPLLIGACQRCHSEGGEAGDSNLILTGAAAADYTTVSRFVDASAAARSRLLSKASGGGHGGGTVLDTTSPEYHTVLEWIQQGARP